MCPAVLCLVEAKTDFCESAVKDIGTVSRRIHPRVYNVIGAIVTACDIFTCNSGEADTIFVIYGETACSVGTNMGIFCRQFFGSYACKETKIIIKRKLFKSVFGADLIEDGEFFVDLRRKFCIDDRILCCDFTVFQNICPDDILTEIAWANADCSACGVGLNPFPLRIGGFFAVKGIPRETLNKAPYTEQKTK